MAVDKEAAKKVSTQIDNDRKSLLRVSRRELKITPTTECRPAFSGS